jgi:two-component system, chemotaxis family, chemotaxis protein CheY
MSHILLVEDNADMQRLLYDLLDFAGHQVTTGRTGLEALDVMENAASLPEFIISDLNMPRLDGLGLLETVRQHPRWKEIPFVIMSANVHDERLTDSVMVNLDGILPKPFSLDDLNSVLGKD